MMYGVIIDKDSIIIITMLSVKLNDMDAVYTNYLIDTAKIVHKEAKMQLKFPINFPNIFKQEKTFRKNIASLYFFFVFIFSRQKSEE